MKQKAPQLGQGCRVAHLGGQSPLVLGQRPPSTPGNGQPEMGGGGGGSKWFKTETFNSLCFLSSLFHFISALLTSILFLLSGITAETIYKSYFLCQFWVEQSIPNTHPLSLKENKRRSQGRWVCSLSFLIGLGI